MPTEQANGIGASESGIAYLTKVREQRSAPAPFERMLGFRLQNVREGEVELIAEPINEYANPMGTVHGGYFSTLLDAAMGAAVHSLLDAGQDFTTVELKVNFMKALRSPFATLRASGLVRRPGKRVMFAEGQIYSETNTLIATATATCLIWERHSENYREAAHGHKTNKA